MIVWRRGIHRFAAIQQIMGLCTVAGGARAGFRPVFCPYISSNVGSSRTAERYTAAHACAGGVPPGGRRRAILMTYSGAPESRC
jgi:hypothetical protein